MIFDINRSFTTQLRRNEAYQNALEHLKNPNNLLSSSGLKAISTVVDEAFCKALNEITSAVEQTNEHLQRITTLERQPTKYGKYSPNKIILEDVSPFEQQLTLKSYLSEHQITTTHTFLFGTEGNDYIPISCKPGGLFNVVLGSTRGSHKAPKYSEWALNDPMENPYQKIFIKSLEPLELFRQPDFAGSSIIKSNIYQNGSIDSDWRYGIYNDPNDPTSGKKPEACVELKGQKGHKNHKQQSCGVNFNRIVTEWESDDQMSKDIDNNIENYQENGIGEFNYVSPEKINKAVIKKIERNDGSDIDKIAFKLLACSLDPLNAETAHSYVARRLFD